MPTWLKLILTAITTIAGVIISTALFATGSIRDLIWDLSYYLPSFMIAPTAILLISIYVAVVILIYWAIWKK